MALKDKAVFTAAQGFLFISGPGTAPPTPTELDALDPERFGCASYLVELSGSPATFTLKNGTTDATPALDDDATAAQVQVALENLASIGAGNVLVEGSADDGFTVTAISELQGEKLVLSGTGVTVSAVDLLNGWGQIGHTSRDDMPEFGFDGGDSKVAGTWQKKRLREVADGDPVADSVTIKLEQWDDTTMELYFGANAATEEGIFGVDGKFAPVEKALLVIIVDGGLKIGFYAAKASFKRDDAVDMPVDEFAGLPVKATFLDMPGRRLYDWINKALFGKRRP